MPRVYAAPVHVHCEVHDAIRFMTEKLEKAGKLAPYYHAVSQPQSVEREAAHRAIIRSELTGVPIMIVHVSGREAMEQIRWAQSHGLKIMRESCTRYLSLTAEDIKGLNMGETGGKYVCPPPHDRASWDAIWNGIQTGVFRKRCVRPVVLALRFLGHATLQMSFAGGWLWSTKLSTGWRFPVGGACRE